MISFKKFLPLSLIVVMFSCTEPDLRVDPMDANGMSNALVLSQEEQQPGDLPPASTHPEAPVLKTERDSLFMFGWSHGNIHPSVVSGDIGGFYVQVKGADHHYKINSKHATANSGGIGFGFVIENSSKPGMFTIRYSIFDTKGRASNIVEQDVFVMDYGGPESMFSFGEEQSAKQITYYRVGQTDVVVVGAIKRYTFEDQLDCVGQPDKLFDNIREITLNESSYVFNGDGSGTWFTSSTVTNLDRASSNSACSPKYLKTTSKEYYEGKWGFINQPNRLLIQFNRIDTVNGVRHIYSGALNRQYSVYKSGSTLIWRSKDDDKEEVIFK
jgi:hypothetical protein